MPSTEYRGPDAGDVVPDVSRVISSVNSVFSLSLILAQTSSPAQAMRLVSTAVPSIAPDRNAVAWHPSRSGDYYEQAPEDAHFAFHFVAEHARTRAEQELALKALREKCEILWAQLDAIHYSYVQPGWAPPSAFHPEE